MCLGSQRLGVQEKRFKYVGHIFFVALPFCRVGTRILEFIYSRVFGTYELEFLSLMQGNEFTIRSESFTCFHIDFDNRIIHQ